MFVGLEPRLCWVRRPHALSSLKSHQELGGPHPASLSWTAESGWQGWGGAVGLLKSGPPLALHTDCPLPGSEVMGHQGRKAQRPQADAAPEVTWMSEGQQRFSGGIGGVGLAGTRMGGLKAASSGQAVGTGRCCP